MNKWIADGNDSYYNLSRVQRICVKPYCKKDKFELDLWIGADCFVIYLGDKSSTNHNIYELDKFLESSQEGLLYLREIKEK